MPAARRVPRPLPPPESPGIENARTVLGKEEALDRVQEYLDEVRDDGEVEGDVTLYLCHLGMGSKSPVETWLFKQDDDPAETAEEIVDRAVDDVLSLHSGKVRYEVKAAVNGTALANRRGFKLETEDNDENELLDTADERGLTAQLMRHLESKDKMIRDLTQVAVASLRSQNAELVQENRSHRGGWVEQQKVFAEMMHRTHALELDTRRFEKAEERKDVVVKQIADHVGVMIPVAMQKLLGIGTKVEPPASTALTPIETLFQKFMGEMTEERMTAIFKALPESKNVLFKELMLFAIGRDEARKRAEKVPDETNRFLDFFENLAAGWGPEDLNSFSEMLTPQQRWVLFEVVTEARKRHEQTPSS